MATATLETAVADLTSSVDYLWITIGRPENGWLTCQRLVTDPGYLRTIVADTRTARGTDRSDVATSLFVQGYVFRIATVAIGSWLRHGAVIATDPATTAIALGRGSPNAVLLDPDSRLLPAAGVAEVHAALIDAHLQPLVDTAHRSAKVGAPLLWGNVAASCAAAFGAFMGSPGARPAEIADRAETFFATARPELRSGGTLVRVADRIAWRRSRCCLWYRTESGFMCEDCSLRSAAEHEARFAAMAAEIPA